MMEYRLEVADLLVKELAPDKLIEVSGENIVITIPDEEKFESAASSLMENIKKLLRKVNDKPVPISITLRNSSQSERFEFNQ